MLRSSEEGHPDAHLIFHQDGDTLVDWRQALPRLLQRVVAALPPTEEELRRLQLGRLCERVPWQLLSGCPGAVELEPCGAGSLYGFSKDVVRWMVDTQGPEPGHRMNYEDMHACRWARRFEEHVGVLESCGLLRSRDFQNAWIHPLKAPCRVDSKLLPSCFRPFGRIKSAISSASTIAATAAGPTTWGYSACTSGSKSKKLRRRGFPST